MRLIVLGKSSDDKGRQLEQLTNNLLKRLGYKKIVSNQVGSGADELDLTAEFSQPSVGKPIIQKVIVECKAYRQPINLPDWLKFLGKLFTMELGQKKVHGCFIALSGANGNVMGHYSEVRKTREDIHLLAGEELFDSLTVNYALKDVGELLQWISGQTGKRVVNTSIAYYEENFYWVVSFSEGELTIISHDGKYVSRENSEEICRMLQVEMDAFTYVDLEADNLAHARAFSISKMALAIFADENGSLSQKRLLARLIKELKHDMNDINAEDSKLALHNLERNGLIVKIGKKFCLSLKGPDFEMSDMIDFYRFTLAKSVQLLVIRSGFYQNNINDALLDAISELQGNLHLSDPDRKKCLSLLKWSPSALNYAITPDRSLLEHRSKFDPLPDKLNAHDSVHFMTRIYELFNQDFLNPALSVFMAEFCKVKEVETNTTITIKGKNAVLLGDILNQRNGIYVMENDGKDQHIIVNILAGEPEPWGNPSK